MVLKIVAPGFARKQQPGREYAIEPLWQPKIKLSCTFFRFRTQLSVAMLQQLTESGRIANIRRRVACPAATTGHPWYGSNICGGAVRDRSPAAGEAIFHG
jgi:hypothetical protein